MMTSGGPAAEGLGVVGLEPDRLVEIAEGLGVVALDLPRPAPPGKGQDVLGVDSEGGVEALDGTIGVGQSEPGLSPPIGISCGRPPPVVGLG